MVFLLVLVLLCFLRTWQMKLEPNQKEFLHGVLPNPKPDGFYQGSVGFKTAWLGKKFDAQNAVGINVVADRKAGQVDKYPFKTYTGNGLFDQKLFVQKIDYNVKGNPFWIKWILDEIVEVAPSFAEASAGKPGQYLGKMNLRIIPGFPFSVLYFELKR